MAQRSQLSLTERTELKTRLGIRFSSILEMSEPDVSQLIAFLESDQLFQKLHRAEDPDWKIFARQRFPESKISSSFYELNEQIIAAPASSVDLQSFLLRHKALLQEIQKIGAENFNPLFCTAVLFANDKILRHINEAASQVSGLGGF